MPTSPLTILSLLCLALPAAALAAAPSPAAFSVGGAVASPQTWTTAALAQRFASQATTLAYTLKGARHTSRAVPLEAVLEASQPKIDPPAKHGVLQGTVTITGQDGYTVVFSLGELSPDFGHEAVWIALDEDSHPLPDGVAPAELIVPGDVKAGRWVHAIASITISAAAAS